MGLATLSFWVIALVTLNLATLLHCVIQGNAWILFAQRAYGLRIVLYAFRSNICDPTKLQRINKKIAATKKPKWKTRLQKGVSNRLKATKDAVTILGLDSRLYVCPRQNAVFCYNDCSFLFSPNASLELKNFRKSYEETRANYSAYFYSLYNNRR